MSLSLAVLLLLLANAEAGLTNLDLSGGTLDGWQGNGFALVPLPGDRRQKALTSVDQEGASGKGLLYRTFTIPAGAGELLFSAAALRPVGVEAGGTLDVVLEAAGRDFLAREVRTEQRWTAAPLLQPPAADSLRSYRWDLRRHVGRRVRLAVLDQDDRPGCYLLCSGFRLRSADEVNLDRFTADMERLRGRGSAAPVRRQESKHFLALSTAAAGFTEQRLDNCEAIHALFFAHFRTRGFTVRPPGEKLLLAIFATPGEMETYLGEPLPTHVTGVYHLPTNRMLVYDYGRNRHYLAERDRADRAVRRPLSDVDRLHRNAALGLAFRDWRDDTNISTMMHEVAHQLSFNGGLLNRHGDVPVWLSEGLATYCESTVRGSWQGPGESNPQRARTLAGPAGAGGAYLPLRLLIQDDRWMHQTTSSRQVVLGYAQSWALFRLLMIEYPVRLRRYLDLIRERRTRDHRLSDFVAAFGDLAKLQARYAEYLRELARREGRDAT